MAGRRGFLLIAVIVCLFVVMVMAGTLVRAIVAHRRQAQVELRESQAFWLAESAYRRAIVKLRADSEYDGEDWAVSDPVTARSRGAAEIRISRPSDGLLRIEVTALWPGRTIHSSRFTKVSHVVPSTGEES